LIAICILLTPIRRADFALSSSLAARLVLPSHFGSALNIDRIIDGGRGYADTLQQSIEKKLVVSGDRYFRKTVAIGPTRRL
jgi:hypothetical protein